MLKIQRQQDQDTLKVFVLNKNMQYKIVME